MADMTIAKEILKQLGGNKFIVMTGAKDFAGGKNSLTFRIGRNSTQANAVNVVLTSEDLYEMQFLRIGKNGIKELKKYVGVYNDQLQPIFTEFTGMYTKLF